MTGRIAHIAAIEVAVPAEQAFEYLADGWKQGEWALGSWNRQQVGAGLFRGTSLFTGATVYVRITPHREQLLVDYEVGASVEALRFVNSARVVPAAALGRDAGCLVALMKWRLPDQDDASWEQACATFDVEIRMIKGRLELGF